MEKVSENTYYFFIILLLFFLSFPYYFLLFSYWYNINIINGKIDYRWHMKFHSLTDRTILPHLHAMWRHHTIRLTMPSTPTFPMLPLSRQRVSRYVRVHVSIVRLVITVIFYSHLYISLPLFFSPLLIVPYYTVLFYTIL